MASTPGAISPAPVTPRGRAPQASPASAIDGGTTPSPPSAAPASLRATMALRAPDRSWSCAAPATCARAASPALAVPRGSRTPARRRRMLALRPARAPSNAHSPALRACTDARQSAAPRGRSAPAPEARSSLPPEACTDRRRARCAVAATRLSPPTCPANPSAPSARASRVRGSVRAVPRGAAARGAKPGMGQLSCLRNGTGFVM